MRNLLTKVSINKHGRVLFLLHSTVFVLCRGVHGPGWAGLRQIQALPGFRNTGPSPTLAKKLGPSPDRAFRHFCGNQSNNKITLHAFLPEAGLVGLWVFYQLIQAWPNY